MTRARHPRVTVFAAAPGAFLPALLAAILAGCSGSARIAGPDARGSIALRILAAPATPAAPAVDISPTNALVVRVYHPNGSQEVEVTLVYNAGNSAFEGSITVDVESGKRVALDVFQTSSKTLLTAFGLAQNVNVNEGQTTTVPIELTDVFAPVVSAPASASVGGAFDVTWTAVSFGAVAPTYALDEDDNAGFTSPTEIFRGSATTFGVTRGTAGDYYYRVRAFNAYTGGIRSQGSSKVTVSTLIPIAQLVAEGWTAFEAGDYTGARAKFAEAATRDTSHAEARLGLAWSAGYLGEFPLALVSASSSLAHAATDQPGLAIRAAAQVVRGAARMSSGPGTNRRNYTLALADADGALLLDPSFVFSHRTEVDKEDVHLIAAQAAYYLGDLPRAQGEADGIGTRVLGGPSNLNRSDPDTWTIDGTKYASYEAALLKYIQKVGSSIGDGLVQSRPIFGQP